MYNLPLKHLTLLFSPMLPFINSAVLRSVPRRRRQAGEVDAQGLPAGAHGDDDRAEPAVLSVVYEPAGPRSRAGRVVLEVLALARARDAFDGRDGRAEARARFELVFFPDSADLCGRGRRGEGVPSTGIISVRACMMWEGRSKI